MNELPTSHQNTQSHKSWKDKVDWPVALFLVLNPLCTFIILPFYIYFFDFPWAIAIFALIFAGLTNLSITAGYHRLFSHRSYEAHPIIKVFFLIVGASGFQGSALKWSSDHRRHHSHEDSDQDPYNIKRGFWHAHMGWLFLKETVDLPIVAHDLQKDPIVMWQHHHYMSLAIVSGFFFPMLVGYFLGSAIGGLVVAGALRIFLTQQSTFFVNSLSHTLGKQTYSKDISARDSIIVALLTHGEGYHNFHHKFQLDYRNGIKWYHWDPTKWTIQFLSYLGLAKKLKTIPRFEILKARIQSEYLRLKESGKGNARVEALKEKLLQNMAQYRQLKEDYESSCRNMAEYSNRKLESLKVDLALAQLEFKSSLKQWRLVLQYA